MNYTTTKLYGITTKKHLSYILKIDQKVLMNIEPLFCADSFTKTKNEKTRTFFDPNVSQRKVLNRINHYLQQIEAPSFAYGGIKGRSYIDNAKVHSSQSSLLLIDIKNFFPSTNDFYVYNFFKNKLAMSTDVAKILTLIVTEKSGLSKNRFIPQGYPTSPLISLFSYIDMFSKIAEIASLNRLNYSCYYDDLTLSSNKYIDKSVLRQIKKTISLYDLKVNENKTRALFNRGSKLTGVIVLPDGLEIPGKIQLQMIQNFDLLMKSIFSETQIDKKTIITLCNKVQGCIASMRSIDKYKNDFDRDLSFYSNKVKEIRKLL